jgi:head-tail adaptor
MDAGRRSARVRFEENAPTQNQLGEEEPNWQLFAQAWAGVIYGNGAERRQAAQTGGSQPATFVVPWSRKLAGLSIEHRINFEGIWDISSVVPRGRDEIEITATRAA